MYRLSFTRLLNHSTLMFTKNATSTFCNVQKPNLQPVRTRNSLINNFTRPRRLLCTDFEEAPDEIFSTLAKAYREHGRVQAHSISNILGESNVDRFTIDQSLLLLQCCGEAIVDKSPSTRSKLCNQVWDKLQEFSVFLNLQHYNKYLDICIENKVKLDYLDFISKMKNCQPNEETYYLLLQCACQLGDIPQAIKIISEMKKKDFSADEKIFGALVLGNAIHSGLDASMDVLSTMQASRISPSSLTYCCLLQGMAERQNYEEFMKALEIHPCEIKEREFLKLLQVLGLHGNHIWINEVLKKMPHYTLTQEGLSQLDLLCIHLVHMKQPEAAFYYYKKFALPRITRSESAPSIFIFVEMLSSGMPPKKVIELVKGLDDIDYTHAIQRITGIALKKGLTNAGWDLFAELPHLRPHYFWPMLLKAARNERENGVFDVITKMLDFGVKPDVDTLECYIIPHCDTDDAKNLLLRLKHFGFSYKELLTPILCYLLKELQLASAQKLCLISKNIYVDADRLMLPLCKACINTKDTNSAVVLLKRMCDPKQNMDYAGKFLVRLFKMCKSPANYNHFLELVKEMRDCNMKISITSADSVMYHLKSLNHRTLSKSVQTAIETITYSDLNNTYKAIPHPNSMTVDELENHLIELQNKDMETRGVLRRLIQNHCRLGNDVRVAELRRQFLDAGYNETAGMKAAVFHVYVIKGNDVGALDLYKEIKLRHPEFPLDDFKIIDFAALLIRKNKYDDVIRLLSESRAIRDGSEIVRNCFQLLNAIDDENYVQNVYELLVEKGYCVPSNIILGPLVRVHLKSGNLQKAVQVYSECAQKHKCTPLQVELLRAVVQVEKNHKLLQDVLNITAKVHGSNAAGVALISTLSQAGLDKPLREFLLEAPRVSKDEIIKLCDRWVQCKDVRTLETLAKAVANFPPTKFDEVIVYNYLMQMHGINNDCEAAVKFYRQLLDLKVNIPETLTQELLRMVHRCNYVIAEDVIIKEHFRS